MQQVRRIIRRTLLEMAWTGPKRAALLRKMDDPDVQRYIAMVDAAASERELRALDKYAIIPNLRDRKDIIGDTPISWALSDLSRAKESELRKASKERERAAIDARKAERAAKKDAVAAKVQQAFSNPILMDALNKIGAAFRASIKASLIDRETKFVQHYFTDGKFNLPEPDLRDRSWSGRAAYETYRHVSSHARPYSERDPNASYYSPEYKVIHLKENWQSIIEASSERQAASIVEKWKHKMGLKLGEVIDRKGGADIKVMDRGTAWDNYMTFDFNDGSSFYMRTQPVQAVSKLGNYFTRFPTTFHKVKFHDGTFMEKPSSERMQSEFGINDASASKD